MPEEKKNPTYQSENWTCVYCKAKFPHNQSAATHFDECAALKERLAAGKK
jgi:hypothetical protein